MRCKVLCSLTFCWLLLSLISFTLGVEQAEVERPNLILIIADDMNWDDCGAYGDKMVKTPAIDQLAREGMRFTSAFAASPLCSPSRCVMGTGRLRRVHFAGRGKTICSLRATRSPCPVQYRPPPRCAVHRS